jgi:predicted DNA-binding transcriptional regulator YafY
MSRHLERLLRIDELLRSGQRSTAKSLAQSLEVSERTIGSDIAFLQNRYSAPIEWSRANGYYYTDLEWRLPSITLTQGELFALILGARMLETYAGSTYAEDLQSAITRLGDQSKRGLIYNRLQINESFFEAEVDWSLILKFGMDWRKLAGRRSPFK